MVFFNCKSLPQKQKTCYNYWNVIKNMSGRKLLVVATLAVMLAGIFSYSQLTKSKLYRFLVSAENSSQLEVTPLILNEDEIPFLTRSLHANLNGVKTHNFSNQVEYVLEDKETGNLFKVAASEGSPVLDSIRKFKKVVIEENSTYTMQYQEPISVISQEDPNQNLSNSLSSILQNLNLGSFQGSLTTKHDQPLVIGIIDSGLDQVDQYAGKIAINGMEKVGDYQSDDDENGYIDDIYGWNFLNNSPLITDLNGHGTHISGIIMAISELSEIDSLGLKIVPIQVLDANRETTLANLLMALEYAKDRDVDLINMSLGAPVDSKILHQKIQELSAAGIEIIAPSGNEGKETVLYPARYPEVIAVSALNSLYRTAPYANYGSEVDVSSQGEVLSLNQNGLTIMKGTSQATAVVTGICAMLEAHGAISQTKDCLSFATKNIKNEKQLLPGNTIKQLKE